MQEQADCLQQLSSIYREMGKFALSLKCQERQLKLAQVRAIVK